MLCPNAFWFGGKQAMPILGTGVILYSSGTSATANPTGTYDLSTNITTYSTSLTCPKVTSYSAGTGITTKGIIFGGSQGSNYAQNSAIYTWSSQTWAAGASITYNQYGKWVCGISSATTGYFWGGQQSSTGGGNSETLYNWSANTMGGGGSLQGTPFIVSTIGNPTQAVLGGGSWGATPSSAPANTTSVRTYSPATYSVGTSLTWANSVQNTVGFSTDTYGIFSGGQNSVGALFAASQRYTFSGNIVSSGLNLTYSVSQAIGQGNPNGGAVLGGINSGGSSIATTILYPFSAGATAVGTSLQAVVATGSGFCSNPGYLS